MVIVLIAARYQKILGWIQNSEYEGIVSIDIMKQNGAKIYLYVETNLTSAQVMKMFHSVIFKESQGVYIYQLYGIYNEKIDFHDYLSSEAKEKMGYYHTKQKDITNQEVEDYLQHH